MGQELESGFFLQVPVYNPGMATERKREASYLIFNCAKGSLIDSLLSILVFTHYHKI